MDPPNVIGQPRQLPAVGDVETRVAFSWVTSSSINSRTTHEFSSSRFPVGSSARINRGRCSRARQMATRCISPPLRLLTGSSARSTRPTRSSNCRTRGSKSRRFPPATSAGRATFSLGPGGGEEDGRTGRRGRSRFCAAASVPGPNRRDRSFPRISTRPCASEGRCPRPDGGGWICRCRCGPRWLPGVRTAT